MPVRHAPGAITAECRYGGMHNWHVGTLKQLLLRCRWRCHCCCCCYWCSQPLLTRRMRVDHLRWASTSSHTVAVRLQGQAGCTGRRRELMWPTWQGATVLCKLDRYAFTNTLGVCAGDATRTMQLQKVLNLRYAVLLAHQHALT
jgi:hypothetical protein